MKRYSLYFQYTLYLIIILTLINLFSCEYSLHNPFALNSYNSFKSTNPIISIPTSTPPFPNLTYYKFDEGVGTSSIDSSGNNYTATLNVSLNNGWTISGKDFNALALSAANSEYVSSPLSLTGVTDFTIALWVYPDSWQDFARIFDFGLADQTKFMFLTGSANSYIQTIRFGITTNGVSNESVLNIPGGALATASWHHLAVVLSGNTAKIYLNGVLKMTNPDVIPKPQDLGATNNYFGKSQFTGDPYFDGKIDDVRIYNYALTTEEIVNLYTMFNDPAPTQIPVPTIDPAKYYRFLSCNNENRCMGVSGSSLNPGTAVILWDDYDTDQHHEQHWQITDVGSGYFKIVNRNSSLVAEVKNSSTLDNEVIQQEVYTGADNQLWQLDYLGSGYFRIMNKNSNKACVCSGDVGDNGTAIVQQTYWGKNGNMWRIVESVVP